MHHDAGRHQYPCVFEHEQLFGQMQIAETAEHADDEQRDVEAYAACPGETAGERKLRYGFHRGSPGPTILWAPLE